MKIFTVYEFWNPSFRDLDLDTQISHGINDWCCEADGKQFFGQTRQEAEQAARRYFN